MVFAFGENQSNSNFSVNYEFWDAKSQLFISSSFWRTANFCSTDSFRLLFYFRNAGSYIQIKGWQTR